MKLLAIIGGQEVPVEITKNNGVYRLTINGKTFSVDAIRPTPLSISVLIDGFSHELGLEKKESRYLVHFFDETVEFELYEARRYRATELTKKKVASGPLKIVAPMPGKIVRIIAQPNVSVNEGDPLLVIEAMKMQNELKASRGGVVKQVNVKEGEAVSLMQTLLVLE